jgi:DNA polymerase-3 subunit alpha
MASIDLAVNYSQNLNAHHANGQTSIFDLGEKTIDVQLPKMPEVKEWTQAESLAYEKEMLGFYVSGHPLSKYDSEVKLFSTCDLSGIHSLKDGSVVRVGIVIAGVKQHFDRKNKAMAFITIEDYSGTAEAIAFSDVYAQFKDHLQPDAMVLLDGKISIKEEEDQAKILINEVIPLAEAWDKYSKNLRVNFITTQLDDAKIQHIKTLLQSSKGKCPIYINIITPDNREYVIKSKKMMARPTHDLFKQLQHSLGEKNVWVES